MDVSASTKELSADLRKEGDKCISVTTILYR